MKDILLLTPPFTQLNTPYPATAYIKGFLNTKDITAYQMDLGIEVILELFSKKGLENIFEVGTKSFSDNCQRILALKNDYLATIDPVISFLQGNNPTLARVICSGNFLPEASRFAQLDDLEYAFGTMGLQDKAKHLATLYLEDISDYIVENIDANFGFSRYAERLGRSANTFDDLYNALQQKETYIDTITLSILNERITTEDPNLVLISVPFPGNLYSAFKCAQYIKKHFPTIKISMGGGFPNTELRQLKDVRVFEFFDFITLDDGELPVELLHNFVQSEGTQNEFKRTFILENEEVVYKNNTLQLDYKQSQVGTPDYSDLALNKYISVIEIANPMHSLWSDGRWNKLTMAHGCYWGKCTFCDISLDYIKIYEPVAAKLLVDRMEELILQTSESGFHFVDEAAPPALMREVAFEILRRNLKVTWWTNIRFEKSFTQDLCALLALSGCVAVSGGLEVASDRLLKLIDKGVTVEQVARVTRNFTESGVLVHAYLMYGYPTQTVQETVDSLEMVRQLFEIGVLQSGFWHQFAMTAHSPVGINPEEYGIIPKVNEILFAHNDIDFVDKTGIDHAQFSFGLKKSLFNFMHHICFEYHLQEWFDFKIPKTTIKSNYISNCLLQEPNFVYKPSTRLVWIGSKPMIEKQTTSESKHQIKLKFHGKTISEAITLETEKAIWLVGYIEKIHFSTATTSNYQQLKDNYETQFSDFEIFWNSKKIQKIMAIFLLKI